MPIKIEITADNPEELFGYMRLFNDYAAVRASEVRQVLRTFEPEAPRAEKAEAVQDKPKEPFVETTDRADEVVEVEEPIEAPTKVKAVSTPNADVQIEAPEPTKPKKRRRPPKTAVPEEAKPEYDEADEPGAEEDIDAPERVMRGGVPVEVEAKAEAKIEPKHEPEVTAAATGLAELPRDVKNLINQAYLHGKSKRASDLLREHGLGAKSYRELNTVALQAVVQAVRGGYLAA